MPCRVHTRARRHERWLTLHTALTLHRIDPSRSRAHWLRALGYAALGRHR